MGAKIRVGVLRGGPSAEYEVSLETGKSILAHLPEAYDKKDLLITKDGTWHLNGLPVGPEKLRQNVDLVFNALHGEYGEDGGVQQVLDDLGVPYTGSGRLASALGMAKHLAKDTFRQAGLRVAPGILLRVTDEDPRALAKQVFQKISPFWIVKPADRGSSVGLYLAKTIDELAEAIAACARYSPLVLVEQFIRGDEATCGVVDNLRGEEVFPLFPIEIRKPKKQEVWTYDDKYSGETEEICPGNFSDEIKQELQKLAVMAHKALGLRHYSRSDFIITPNGQIYILETNSLPGLTSESLLPKALAAHGISYPQFLDHVITLALGAK